MDVAVAAAGDADGPLGDAVPGFAVVDGADVDLGRAVGFGVGLGVGFGVGFAVGLGAAALITTSVGETFVSATLRSPAPDPLVPAK